MVSPLTGRNGLTAGGSSGIKGTSNTSSNMANNPPFMDLWYLVA